MTAFLSKRHVSRRAFIRGSSVVLALPWLDAMLPACATRAQAAEAKTPPKRFVVTNYGLGFHGPFLFPEQAGADYQPSLYLKALEENRRHFSVISGLSHPEQNGANGHASELTVLTSAKHPGLPGFKNTISIDQYICEKLVPDTRFPNLVLSVGSNDSISWTANGVNLPAENSPEKLFRLLFVDGNEREVAEQMAELKRGRSILDTVNGQAKRFNQRLGRRDQEKFDQYLTSVRELETRLQASQGWVNRPKPKVDVPPPKDINDRLDVIARSRLMHEMMVLALQTDSTRIISLKASASNQVPRIDGVSTGWHDLSHHGRDEQKIEELSLIELAEFRELNSLLNLMKDATDSVGSVLDNTSLLVLSNLGNASSHSWRDLPVILAGGGFKHGQHIVAGGNGTDNNRLGNLFVQLAQHVGVETDQFGSSNTTSIDGLKA